MRLGAGFPPRARQAAQPPEIDQVHRCTPDPGRYAARGDAPVYAPPRPQDWADAGPSMATNNEIAIAVPKTLLILTPLKTGRGTFAFLRRSNSRAISPASMVLPSP